jgi:hypothetical protein
MQAAQPSRVLLKLAQTTIGVCLGLLNKVCFVTNFTSLKDFLANG